MCSNWKPQNSLLWQESPCLMPCRFCVLREVSASPRGRAFCPPLRKGSVSLRCPGTLGKEMDRNQGCPGAGEERQDQSLPDESRRPQRRLTHREERLQPPGACPGSARRGRHTRSRPALRQHSPAHRGGMRGEVMWVHRAETAWGSGASLVLKLSTACASRVSASAGGVQGWIHHHNTSDLYHMQIPSTPQQSLTNERESERAVNAVHAIKALPKFTPLKDFRVKDGKLGGCVLPMCSRSVVYFFFTSPL